MKAIGFRVEASENQSALHWAVVEGTKDHPIYIGAATIKVPTTYDEALALPWFRNEVQRLIKVYSPDRAALRTPETRQLNPRFANLYKRCRIEGVILETSTSLGLEVEIGASITIAANIESHRSLKEYLQDPDLRGLDWSKHKPNVREAILAASSVLASE
ncbi:MAG: hypothetical protein ACLPWF_17010 [Bryobacteraceae bacterium]